jgi:hypothetical protein
MLRKIITVLAYILLFLLSVVLFAYFTFPLEKLRDYIERKVNTSPKFRLEIEEIERDGLGALVLSNVQVGVNRKLVGPRGPKPGAPPATSPPAKAPASAAAAPAGAETEDEGAAKEAEEGETEETQAEKADEDFFFVTIDSITVDFSPLMLFDPSDISIGVSMELLGGTVEDGTIELIGHEGKTRVALDFPTIAELHLSDTEFFGKLFSSLLPSMKADKVNGIIEKGAFSLRPEVEEEIQFHTGRIDLELTELVAMAPVLIQYMKRTQQKVELPLTDLKLGRCTFALRIDRKDRIEELDKVKTPDQQATAVLFEKAECKGESLDYFIAENSFILLPQKASFAKATMDFWTRMAFNPDYFEEERLEEGKPVTKNKEMGQGLDFDPTWQKAKDLEGFYWMHCKGTFSKPKCKRGLPPEEKRRKKAMEKLEKDKLKEKQKADKAREKEEAKNLRKNAPPPAASGRDAAASARARREDARKEAEASRKARDEGRVRPTLADIRSPSPPSVSTTPETNAAGGATGAGILAPEPGPTEPRPGEEIPSDQEQRQDVVIHAADPDREIRTQHESETLSSPSPDASAPPPLY